MRAPSNLVARMGGVAAVLGGVLWSAKAFHDRNDAPPWPTDVTDTLSFVVPLLFLAGFAGLYARSRGCLEDEWRAISSGAFAVGSVGLAGSAVGLLTMALEAGPSWWVNASWMLFVFGFFAGNLGLVFFGTSVLQDEALPRLRGLPIATRHVGHPAHPDRRPAQQRDRSLPDPRFVDALRPGMGRARVRRVGGGQISGRERRRCLVGSKQTFRKEIRRCCPLA